MNEPAAYLNGQWVSASQAVVSVEDIGFLVGAAATERLRTFHGRLFRIDEHLRRLGRSLEIMGTPWPEPESQVAKAAEQLASQNHAMLESGDDLYLSLFVTPGRADVPGKGTIGMTTGPLPFDQWAGSYQLGVPLVVSSIRHMPPECLPPELKCRSRMHYYLADREASARRRGARALLLDADGHVAETSTANVLMFRKADGISAPRLEKVLPGVSIHVLKELAHAEGIPWQWRDITDDELSHADEVMLTSTSPCLLPVTSVGESVIGDGNPGPLFQKLLAAWGDLVGVDLVGQAKRFADRR